MKTLFARLNEFGITVFLLCLFNPILGQDLKYIGNWEGKLLTQSGDVRVVFNITEEIGKYSITFDIPDRSVTKIPVSIIKLEDDFFQFEVPLIKAYYEGVFDNEENYLNGTWHQNERSLPLILSKIKVSEKLNRPQTPQPPFPYKEVEVSYENKKDGIILSGTLTIPENNEPFPAVILITGSGPQDRDETIFGHKPFWVIADYLTRRGIAVLRVDDRGIGGSTGDFSEATTLDFSEDVLSGVNFLLSRNDIDKTKIGLIGHSEGGLIAPMVAAESDNIAFIIMLAGPALPGDEILLLQAELIAKTHSIPENIIIKSIGLNRMLYDVVKISTDVSDMKVRLRETITVFISHLNEEEKKIQMFSEEYLLSQIKILTSPWLSFFLKHDPKPFLENISCPVLAIYGEKDIQVPPKENIIALEEIISNSRAQNQYIEILEIDGVNHLFQRAETGSPDEYGLIEETFSQDVLRIMGDWITETIITSKDY